jgi:beta-lactamase regulating signal transducer with metallopeptidase domain
MIVAGLLARIAMAVVRVRRLAGAATPAAERIAAAVGWVARRGNVGRRVRVAASRDISAPAFAGFIAPVLLLPARDIDSMPDEQLRLAAAHELAHAHRRDDWFALGVL